MLLNGDLGFYGSCELLFLETEVGKKYLQEKSHLFLC